MDYQITWSPAALDDIDDIAEFIQKNTPYYAQSVVEKMIAQSRTLHYQPLRGRVVPELKNETYREVFIHSYRMIYRIERQEVFILAVIPGKEPMDTERFGSGESGNS